jgi:growth factor activator
MGRRAWVPSPCPTSGLCPLLLLLLLLLLEPRGTQPQTGRVSTDLPPPCSVPTLGFWDEARGRSPGQS